MKFYNLLQWLISPRIPKRYDTVQLSEVVLEYCNLIRFSAFTIRPGTMLEEGTRTSREAAFHSHGLFQKVEILEERIVQSIQIFRACLSFQEHAASGSKECV